MGDIDKLMGSSGQTSVADAQLQKLMFEGGGGPKKKLKLADISSVPASLKEEIGSQYFNRLWSKPLDQHFYIRFIEEVIPKQGAFLMTVCRYRTAKHSADRKEASSGRSRAGLGPISSRASSSSGASEAAL